MWPVVCKLIMELLCILFALFVFVFFVGIKVKCAECHTEFYSYLSRCPSCGLKAGDLPEETPPPPSDKAEQRGE
ncbi:MAG: hypothetical protein WC473_04855 [Patescibacteria group bacterium]|jgi:hypothetical protein